MYVQAYSGSDTVGTGEISSPVATLGKALAVAKEKYNENPDKYPKTEIIVGDGTYDVNGTIYINENYAKFGEGGLEIKAQAGANPVFAGGTSYSISEAVKVDDEEVLARLSSNAAKENLYELDLTTKIKLSDIPAVNYPGSYNLNSMLSSVGLENPPSVTCEALFDNNLMTVARYPNFGYAKMGTIVDAGIQGQHMLSSFDGTENDLEITEENLLKGFEFKTDYENLSNWQTADQALIFGYFIYNWATQSVPLKEINTENGTIRSKYPSYYGVAEGARYYVYNLLEEIDMPGEYFIDRKTGKLYFYMPTDVTDTSTIRIIKNDGKLIDIRDVENVTIEGIKVTGSRSTAIYLDGNNNTIKNCEISNTGSYGVNVRGTNNTVDNCYIHDTNVGVLLEGGVTETLTPGNNVVKNCEITRFSRTNKTYTPAVSIYGVGNKVTHNEIHNGEHTALTYSGQKHEISYNEVYDVCKEVDDAGALYVGRKWTDRGNKIISNYFHDIQSSIIETNVPIAALYFDDHYAGAYVEGNVFANVAGYGIHGNGGREHTIVNNVFVNCSNYSTYMRDSGLDKTYETHINGLNTVPYTSEIWRREFPELYNIFNNAPSYPVDHIFTKNLSVNCGEGYFYGNLAKAYAKNISDNYVTNEDPGFKDMANKDYTITTEALLNLIEGFKTIEFDKMGRQ